MEDGRPFGHYRLLQMIGRGGMGEVWRAYDTATDRTVALKVLPANLAGDETFQRRFRREARVAAALTEPHVVPIHGYGEIDGCLYVDMRLIAGQDLSAVLAEGPLPPARAVTIVEQVAAALQAAHDEGLVHRDVKPSNILVTKSDFAYLIDFGIARTAGESGLTSVGSTIGTWAYMAPERFSAGDPDPRSDVYALACVLHQILTGHQPFPGSRVEQQVTGHLSTPPPSPSAMIRGVQPAFDFVIAKGMAKRPEDRFQTASELAEAARGALASPTQQFPLPPQQMPTQLRPLTPPVQNWPAQTPPSYPAHAGPPAPPMPISSPPGQFSTPPPAHFVTPPPMPYPAAPQSNRNKVLGIAAAAVVVVAIVAAGVFFVTRNGGPSGPVTGDGPTTSELPSGPSFDGTFTATYESATNFDGQALDGDPPDAVNFVVKSSCARSGCVASATTVDRPDGVQTFTFDYVDGRWVSVGVEGGSACGDVTSDRWRMYSLDPDPDGSLAGEFRSIWPSGGCNTIWKVYFERTGDADSGVQVTDPDIAPALVTSPAQAFRGRYHSVQTYTNGDTYQGDYAVETYCLRAGDRCISFAHNPDVNEALVYSGNQWVSSVSAIEGKCTDGAQQFSDLRTTYPLPQPAADPIPVLSGNGTQIVTGGCTGTNTYTQVYTRTGN